MLQDIGNQSSILFFSIIKSFINIEIYCDTCIDSSDAFKSITHTTICYDYIFNVWTITLNPSLESMQYVSVFVSRFSIK